jgi:hypothetical protein
MWLRNDEYTPLYPGVGGPDPGALQSTSARRHAFAPAAMEANPGLASSAKQLGSRFACDGRGRRSIQALPFVVVGLVAVTYPSAQDR